MYEEDKRIIKKSGYYKDVKKWREEMSKRIYDLVYGYDFHYYQSPTYNIGNDSPKFEYFLERIKKGSFSHRHEIVLYKVHFTQYSFTSYDNIYVIAIYKKNEIELFTLGAGYSKSEHYRTREKTATTFIKAFKRANEDAVTARQERESNEIHQTENS